MGVETRDTTTYSGTDYADFKSNNTVFSSVGGDTATNSYRVIGDSRIIIDGDTSTIQALTNNVLTLYSKEVDGNNYYEYTTTLKR